MFYSRNAQGRSNGHSFMIFATNQMKGVLMLVLKVFLIALAMFNIEMQY